jgi:hypothetical protein
MLAGRREFQLAGRWRFAGFTQVASHPRQRLTQRALPLADRIPTPPHRLNQRLLFDVKPNRTHTHPDLHQHIIICLQ